MATTTNYSWTTPDDTALVKDGAAAIRSLGTSIDTTTKNLNPETTLGDISYRSSTANVNTRLPLGTAGQVLKVNSGATAPEWSSDNAGMTNPMTTTGDTIYSSSGSTPARLAIGSTGNVLTVAGGVPTWAAPAAPSGANFVLLNAGGTSLSGATTTISGISGKDQIFVVVNGQSATNASSQCIVRLNGNSSNYMHMTLLLENSSVNVYERTDGVYLGQMSNNANSSGYGSVLFSGCNSTGVKVFESSGGFSPSGGSGQRCDVGGGTWSDSSTVSSVSVSTTTGTWDAGTIYVYTTA